MSESILYLLTGKNRGYPHLPLKRISLANLNLQKHSSGQHVRQLVTRSDVGLALGTVGIEGTGF